MLPKALLDSAKAGELLYKFVHNRSPRKYIFVWVQTGINSWSLDLLSVLLPTALPANQKWVMNYLSWETSNHLWYANHKKIDCYSFSVITEIFSALKFQSHISFYFLYMVRSEKSSSDNVDKCYIEKTRLGKNIWRIRWPNVTYLLPYAQVR